MRHRAGEELNSQPAAARRLDGAEQGLAERRAPGDRAAHRRRFRRPPWFHAEAPRPRRDDAHATARLAVVPHERLARDHRATIRGSARIYWLFYQRRCGDPRASWRCRSGSGRRSRAWRICSASFTRGSTSSAGQAATVTNFPLTQRELSECLGLTVVHANRTLQELRRRGLVELENRQLTILDRRGPRRRRRVRSRLSLSRPRCELLADAVLDPVGIGAEDLVDRPGGDARHVVAVQRGDARRSARRAPIGAS